LFFGEKVFYAAPLVDKKKGAGKKSLFARKKIGKKRIEAATSPEVSRGFLNVGISVGGRCRKVGK